MMTPKDKADCWEGKAKVHQNLRSVVLKALAMLIWLDNRSGIVLHNEPPMITMREWLCFWNSKSQWNANSKSEANNAMASLWWPKCTVYIMKKLVVSWLMPSGCICHCHSPMVIDLGLWINVNFLIEILTINKYCIHTTPGVLIVVVLLCRTRHIPMRLAPDQHSASDPANQRRSFRTFTRHKL